MKRIAIILITLIVIGCGLYFLDQYWIHRYDAVIAREAARHHVDPDLVWSIAYEETYFRPWKRGRNGEIGLMQVTPVVAREWAADSNNTFFGGSKLDHSGGLIAQWRLLDPRWRFVEGGKTQVYEGYLGSKKIRDNRVVYAEDDLTKKCGYPIPTPADNKNIAKVDR